MTAQISDYVVFNGKGFSLIDTEKGKDLYLTIPVETTNEAKATKNFGFLNSTACYRHHFAYYFVKEDILYGVDGKNCETEETIEFSDKFKKCDYTGAMLIAYNNEDSLPLNSDFIASFIRADEAYEIHFKKGKLDDIVDLKPVIESFREGTDNYNKYLEIGNNFEFEKREKFLKTFLKYKYNEKSTYKWL